MLKSPLSLDSGDFFYTFTIDFDPKSRSS